LEQISWFKARVYTQIDFDFICSLLVSPNLTAAGNLKGACYTHSLSMVSLELDVKGAVGWLMRTSKALRGQMKVDRESPWQAWLS